VAISHPENPWLLPVRREIFTDTINTVGDYKNILKFRVEFSIRRFHLVSQTMRCKELPKGISYKPGALIRCCSYG
jgi:hypothetical protein